MFCLSDVLFIAYKVIAGSYLSVNVIAGSVSAQKLSDLQILLETTKIILESNDQAQIAALSREELLGDMFYAGTLGYYAQLQTLSHMAGLASKGHYQLAAGIGTIGYEPKVNYFFGFPRAIQPGGVSFDIPFIYNTANGDGDVEQKKQYTTQVGIISSTLEHATPEQMFASQDPNDPQPNAISAVKALQIASIKGQRIYQITQANMAAVLPNIHHDQETMDEIRASLNAGKEVITHASSVSVPGWSGAGYIIIDPEMGDGAYKITGGSNGGWLVILTFLGLALLMFALAFFGNFVGAALVFVQYVIFAERVKNIAKTANSEEEAYSELKNALFLTVSSVLLAVVATNSPPAVVGSGTIATLTYLSLFIGFWGFAWYT